MDRLCSSFSLRHFVRSSAMLIPGVSSIKRLDRPITPALSISFSHSSSFNWPVRRFWASTLDCSEKSRFTNCSLLISRLKIATVRSSLKAICWAIFSTNAVLPMDGRAAISTRSEGCRPAVR